MKKVLIISYFYPPCNLPASNRVLGWAAYFNDFGLYPIIVTRHWDKPINKQEDLHLSCGTSIKHEVNDNHEVYYLPYKSNLRDNIFLKYKNNFAKNIRKTLTFFELFFQNYFVQVVPYKNFYFFAKEYVKNNLDISLIIITGNPFVLFKFGDKLHKEFSIPWIADYRDDWNTSEIWKPQNLAEKIIKKIEQKSEKKWLASSAFFISVSDHYVNKISSFINKKGYVIYNGFFEKLKEYLFQPFFSDFTITYNGTLYKTQEIGIFLDGFKKIADYFREKLNVMLYFPGLAYDPFQADRVSKYMQGYEANLIITTRIPRKEVLNIEARSHCLLMISHHDIKGIPSSKIFEYIAFRKPIILCPTDNDVLHKILLQTGLGLICNNSDEVFISLKKMIIEFIETDKLQTRANESSIQLYSRRFQTETLANLIEKYIPASQTISYRQCNRCVMDTSDPDITFDSNGYCNHCTEYFEKTIKYAYTGKLSDDKFEKLLKKIKKSGKNNDYDCVIGISGGVDSVYTAYKAQKLGLRPLAVHLDNGWNTELAESNIEKTLNKLNIELITVVLDWKEFSDLQLAFLKASVIEAETPTDIAILAVLHQIAAQQNIKYIFSGGNYVTEGILPKNWHYNAKDVKYLKAIHTKFAAKKLKIFPTFGFQKEMYYKIFKGINMIYPLNYISYNKKGAIKILEKELGWRDYGGKHHESIYTKFIQSYYLYEKFRIDYRRATFSTQICSGEITRDEALIGLTQKPFDTLKIEEEKEYICKKFKLSPEEFNEILSLPPKTYKEYPNDEKKLEFVYYVYRKLYNIK